MPVMGLYCSTEKFAQKIEDTISLLLAAGRQKGEDFGLGPEGCRIRRLKKPPCPPGTGSDGETEGLSWLLLSCGSAKETLLAAEAVWERDPALPVIFVAGKAEDVFAALPRPFFHIVRQYALEQDLAAVFEKIGRTGKKADRWQVFPSGNGMIRVRQKEILYLESDRHEIRVHCGPEEILFGETLARWEEELKDKGFARIHKSFLVNLYHVSRLERESLTLDTGQKLYISKYRYPEVRRQFEQYIRHLDFL